LRLPRALLLPVTTALAALALAGCMQTGQQVAMGPRSDLDAMAYGQLSYSSSPVASADSGGAIVPLGAPIGPGDTILVGERWF
jgi:polysaccharide biosynthesis/export protein